jgi:hemerythrin-like metal-binding protein
MTRLFSWKLTDSVDVELLDRQHQALFATVQELYDALARADGVAVAEDVFSRLVDYSSNHFAAEEALMKQHNYPRFKTHQFDHRNFSQQLLNFENDFRAGNQSVVATLLPYLQQWIKNHVQGADHQFGEFMKSQTKAKSGAAGT